MTEAAAASDATRSRRPRTIRVGLTGPIGCGKSTIARQLGRLGATIVDADQVAREVTAAGTPGHAEIIERFGVGVTGPDGVVDRAALGRLVFDDPAALRELEGIVHPLVRPAILDRIAAAERDGAPAVVVEAIRLVEGGLAALCDVVVLVTCLPEEQRTRLIDRGASADDADRRIKAQAGLVERVRNAVEPVVLDTSGPPERTKRLVDELWSQLRAAAADGGRPGDVEGARRGG